MAGMWYLSKDFLTRGNISLSIHKNEENTRTGPFQKSNSTILILFLSMINIKIFTTGGVLWEGVESFFFDSETKLFL